MLIPILNSFISLEKTPPLDEGWRGRHILLPFLHLLNTILEHVGTSNKPSTIVLHVP